LLSAHDDGESVDAAVVLDVVVLFVTVDGGADVPS
jgi:hypothetical protein